VVPEDARKKVGYAGRPYPHVEVAIADPVTGEHLKGPGRGELLVSGPSIFAGYFRNREATEAAFANGWLRTGDLVEIDADGDIRIVDRLKDIFISGGENVSPAEVEQILLSHPAVLEAAVIGVADARWGEVGRAFIVRRPGVLTDEIELREFCRERLASFKVPAIFEFVGSLPKSGLSKISRARLRSAPFIEYDAAASEGGQR
jgi:fatty-acyl-CoA synthase